MGATPSSCAFFCSAAPPVDLGQGAEGGKKSQNETDVGCDSGHLAQTPARQPPAGAHGRSGKMDQSRGGVSKCNHRSRGRRPPTRHLIGVFGLRPRGCARSLQGEVTPGLRREWTVWETWGSLTFDRCVNGPKCPGCVRRAAPAYGRAQERGSESASNAPGGARRS